MLFENIIKLSNLHIHFQVLCNPDRHHLYLPAACPKTENTSIAKVTTTNNRKLFNCYIAIQI